MFGKVIGSTVVKRGNEVLKDFNGIPSTAMALDLIELIAIDT